MKKIKIMPFGDSMTNGFSVEGAYRNRLCDLIEENGMAEYVEFVGSQNTGTGYNNANEGHSGWAIAQVPAECDVDGKGRDGITTNADEWLSCYKPDIVLLQIGTNDIISLYDLDNAPKRLEVLVDKILSAISGSGRMYIARIPYFIAGSQYDNTGKTQDEINAMIDRYNSSVTLLAEKKGITVVDINACISLSDLADGVHPTADGYAKMGELWFDTIKEELKTRINE